MVIEDAIVIGGGIIGATVTKALRDQGRSVTLFDDAQPMAATKASGGHMKPSWFPKELAAEQDQALQLLAETWSVKEEQFMVYPEEKIETLYRVDTEQVIQLEKVRERVGAIDSWNNYPSVTTTAGTELRCRLLVIAAGIWTTQLLSQRDQFDIKGRQGISYKFSGSIDMNFIIPWAPYKQVVAHQQSANEVWIGDGTAIKPENWNEQRSQQCYNRCANHVIGLEYRQSVMGIRPYAQVAEMPCYFKQLFPRVYVVTGTGKSGTICAGWAARRILDATS